MKTGTVESIATNAEWLLNCLPRIAEAVGESGLETDKRWAAFRESTTTLRGPLVVTLFGPSGAGKSTIFRMLTGIEVPAGTITRPCTRQCLLAVPDSHDEPTLAASFPSAKLLRLDSVEQLRGKELPPGALYFSRYQPGRENSNLFLADVPDCNTTDQENWARAERLLERAEVVIFVTSRHHYASQVENEYLARACGLAGHLAFVLTMTTDEQAAKIWRHLREELVPQFALDSRAVAGEPSRPFDERRADGATRADFLGKADVYFSPESRSPSLGDIRPLAEGKPPLGQFLNGHDLEKIRLAKHRNAQTAGLACACEMLARHERLVGDVEKARRGIEFDLDHLDIVGSSMPLGETLAIMRDTAEKTLPGWKRKLSFALRLVTLPFKGILWLVGKVVGLLRDWISRNPGGEKRIGRDHVEHHAMSEHAQRLTDEWRKRLPENIRPDAGSCSTAIARLNSSVLPVLDENWENFVRRRTAEWVKANEWKATGLLCAGEAIAFFASIALTIDAMNTGGLITFVFGKGTAFAGGAGLGTFMEWINKWIAGMGLQGLLNEFFDEWKAKRNPLLRAHLRKHFADDLILNSLRQRRDCLRNIPVADAQKTAAALRRQLDEFNQ